MSEKYYKVGVIVNTQALKGEVRVMAITDFPDERFKIGSRLTIFDKGNLTEEVEVDGHRRHKNFHLLHFKNHPTINDVEGYKGMSLMVAESERNEELSANEFYYDDIVGLAVYTIDDDYLGKIREIMELPANDVFVVQQPVNGKKDILIPYIEDVVKVIDVEQGKIVIEEMEGLIE